MQKICCDLLTVINIDLINEYMCLNACLHDSHVCVVIRKMGTWAGKILAMLSDDIASF